MADFLVFAIVLIIDDEKFKKVLKYRIDEVLHYIWDPIGVSDMPEARNEYAAYADHVWREVLDGKTEAEIAAYLTEVTTDRMELHPRKSRDEKVAEIIVGWTRFLKNPYEG